MTVTKKTTVELNRYAGEERVGKRRLDDTIRQL